MRNKKNEIEIEWSWNSIESRVTARVDDQTSQIVKQKYWALTSFCNQCCAIAFSFFHPFQINRAKRVSLGRNSCPFESIKWTQWFIFNAHC